MIQPLETKIGLPMKSVGLTCYHHRKCRSGSHLCGALYLIPALQSYQQTMEYNYNF